MNAVVGIQDKEQARQFLLQRGVEAFRKQSGYIPQVELPEFRTPFYRHCETHYEMSEENVRNNLAIASICFENWCTRYTGECPWNSTVGTEIIIGRFWERYNDLETEAKNLMYHPTIERHVIKK